MDQNRISRRGLLAGAVGALASVAIASPAAATLTVPPMQRQWAPCGKCLSVYFYGYRTNQGRCAGDGRAHRAVSPFLKLIHDTQPSRGQQGAWRFCNACNVLFFDGYPGKGVCPASGRGHVAQGYTFVLGHDHPNGTAQWRFCDKCYALFNSFGGRGRCPAGDVHRAAGFHFDLLPA